MLPDYEINLTNDLALWPILRTLSHEFLSQVNRFYAFNNGESIILTAKSGKTYVYGKNLNHKLGVKKKYFNYEVELPEELPELNSMHLHLEEGQFHMMALNSRGHLYGWGANKFGQIGMGMITPISSVFHIMDNVQQVSCGLYHTLALTKEGRVFFWGKISWSADDAYMQDKPTEFSEISDGTKIIDIACNRSGLILMTDQKKLMVFGKLGMTSFSSLTNIAYHLSSPIKQIVGLNYNYNFLLENGEIFSSHFRDEDWNEDLYSLQLQPFRWKHKQKAQKIFVSKDSDFKNEKDHLIIAFYDGFCIIPHLFRFPETLIWFTSIADINALYINSSSIQMTILPPHLVSPSYLILLNDFNNCRVEKDGTINHVKFLIQNRPLYVHRSFLMERSKYFFRMFTEDWADSSDHQNGIRIDNYCYPVYYYYLRYLYTDSLFVERHFEKELFDLANEHDEPDLKRKLAMQHRMETMDEIHGYYFVKAH